MRYLHFIVGGPQCVFCGIWGIFNYYFYELEVHNIICLLSKSYIVLDNQRKALES